MPDPALLAQADAAADAYGIPRDLFRAQIAAESSWNTTAENPQWPVAQGGPQGIAQFTVGTARQYNVNTLDPVSSLWGAAQYDYDLFKQKGSWSKALQSYGTLPTTGPLNAGQQAALAAAQQADGSGITPQATGAAANPNKGGAGFQGNAQQTTTPPIGGGAGAVIQSAVSSFYNILIRAGLILLGIVVIWQGLAMMRNTTIVSQVQYMRGKVKGET